MLYQDDSSGLCRQKLNSRKRCKLNNPDCIESGSKRYTNSTMSLRQEDREREAVSVGLLRVTAKKGESQGDYTRSRYCGEEGLEKV